MEHEQSRLRINDNYNKKSQKKKVENMMTRRMNNTSSLELNIDIANLSIDLNLPVNQIISLPFQTFLTKWFLDFKLNDKNWFAKQIYIVIPDQIDEQILNILRKASYWSFIYDETVVCGLQ